VTETAVDHWYQLHVKHATIGTQFLGAQALEGPMDRAQIERRMQQIIDCQPDSEGRLAVGAVGFRINVNSVQTMEARPERCAWEVVGESSTLSRDPLLVSRAHEVKEGEIYSWDLDVTSDHKVRLNLSVSREFEVGVDLGHLRVRAGYTRERQVQVVAPSSSETDNQLVTKFTSPIVGFRSWVINVPSLWVANALLDGEPQLLGLAWLAWSEFFEWRDAEKVAECATHLHRAPSFACDCGVYASRYGRPEPRLPIPALMPRAGHVDGVVLGSGDVLVHEDGWRAETARIIGFRGDNVNPRVLPALRHIAQKFEVPILPIDRLLKLALDKGGMIIDKSELPDDSPAVGEVG
jgi:hypothetical protein